MLWKVKLNQQNVPMNHFETERDEIEEAVSSRNESEFFARFDKGGNRIVGDN